MPNPLFRFPLLPESCFRLARFLIAGISAAGVNILILYLLVELAGLYYLIAAVLSYIASIGAGFTLQKFWAFNDRSTKRAHIQFASYTAVTLGNLCINTMLMYALVSLLHIWYIAAQILCGAVIAVTGYLAYRTFVFRNPAVKHSSVQ